MGRQQKHTRREDVPKRGTFWFCSSTTREFSPWGSSHSMSSISISSWPVNEGWEFGLEADPWPELAADRSISANNEWLWWWNEGADGEDKFLVIDSSRSHSDPLAALNSFNSRCVSRRWTSCSWHCRSRPTILSDDSSKFEVKPSRSVNRCWSRRSNSVFFSVSITIYRWRDHDKTVGQYLDKVLHCNNNIVNSLNYHTSSLMISKWPTWSWRLDFLKLNWSRKPCSWALSCSSFFIALFIEKK